MWRILCSAVFLATVCGSNLKGLKALEDSGETDASLEKYDDFLRLDVARRLRHTRQIAIAGPTAGAMPMAGMPMAAMPVAGVPVAGMSAGEIASLPAVLAQLNRITQSVIATQAQQQGTPYAGNVWANQWANSYGMPGGYMAPRPEPVAMPMPGYNPYARTNMNLAFNLNYDSGCGKAGQRYPVAGSGFAQGAGGQAYPSGYGVPPRSCPEPGPEPIAEPAPVMPVANAYAKSMGLPGNPLVSPMNPMMFAADKKLENGFVPHMETTTEVATTTPDDGLITPGTSTA